MAATLQLKPQIARKGAYAEWVTSLDPAKVVENNSKILYRNLPIDIEKQILEVVRSDPQRGEPLYDNENVNKIVFSKYLDDHHIGKNAVYPLSGLNKDNLPSYVLEKSEAAYFLDIDPEFPLCSCDGKIIEMRHDVREGLPGIKDIDLVIFKNVLTWKLKKMHRDIKENTEQGGLVANMVKIPNEMRYGNIGNNEYSLGPSFVYYIHGDLESYTAPDDYTLSKISKKELTQTTGKTIRTLSDLTPWQFFEVV